MYRGYYTVVRRYEFYVWVARTLPHEWAKRMSEILFLPLKQKIHIFELTCNVLLLYRHTDDGVFDDFLKISNHFLKISEDFAKLFRRPDECSRTFSENFWRLPKTFKEDPKMFPSYTNEFKEAQNSFHFSQTSFTSSFPNKVRFIVSVGNLP